jgi:hypothetical protein
MATNVQLGDDSRLGPILLLQLLYAMVVIIGEWHRSRHSDLGKGDHECFSSFRGDNMAHDAAFVARIR